MPVAEVSTIYKESRLISIFLSDKYSWMFCPPNSVSKPGGGTPRHPRASMPEQFVAHAIQEVFATSQSTCLAGSPLGLPDLLNLRADSSTSSSQGR